jgi:hypothetical protein
VTAVTLTERSPGRRGDAFLSVQDLHVSFRTEDGVVKAVNGLSLDKKIMETITPLVPALNDVGLQIRGSLVGGAEVDPISWVISPNTIFVKNS